MNKRNFKKEIKKCVSNNIISIFKKEKYDIEIVYKSKKIIYTHYYNENLFFVCENCIKNGGIKYIFYHDNEILWCVNSSLSLRNFGGYYKKDRINKLINNIIKSIFLMFLSDINLCLEKKLISINRKIKIKNLL